MIFLATLLTGISSALLRSAVALIIVSFLIALLYLVAAIFFGTGLFAFLLAVGGFNAGLILFAAAHILAPRPHR